MARGVIGNTLGSGPRDSWFESRRANSAAVARDGRSDAEGWLSGLKRRPAKALGPSAREGSNPSPSAPGRRPPGRSPVSSHTDGWPSGLRRTIGNRVGAQRPSRVRIPPHPLSPSRRGGRIGNAPVSKTGALTGLWVRVPPPPLPVLPGRIESVHGSKAPPSALLGQGLLEALPRVGSRDVFEQDE